MMFLKNITDVNRLREAIDLCHGDVMLRSADGKEELNLKSQLSQYIAIERLHRECGDEYEFFCMNQEDEAVMLEFFHDLNKYRQRESGTYKPKHDSVQAFRFDGDLVDSNGKYYIPDWAIKAHEERRMFFESLTMDGPFDTLFVKYRSAMVPVKVGDYIVQLPDKKTLIVLDKDTMEKLFERNIEC